MTDRLSFASDKMASDNRPLNALGKVSADHCETAIELQSEPVLKSDHDALGVWATVRKFKKVRWPCASGAEREEMMAKTR